MRQSRSILVTRISLACGLALAFSLIGPDSAIAQQTPGEACIFNAPNGAGNLGHVGWGFRDGTGDSWVFGATEDAGSNLIINPGAGAKAASQSWQETGSYAQMLNDFGIGDLTDAMTGAHYQDGAGYYRRYRCSLISESSPDQAKQEATTAESSGYNFFVDNCLTKAIQILGAYGFTDLPIAGLMSPDVYFVDWLPGPTATTSGFSPLQYLTTLTVGVQILDPVDHLYLNDNPIHTQRPMTVEIYQDNSLVFNAGVVGPAIQTPAGTDRYQLTFQLPTDVLNHLPVWSYGGAPTAYVVRVKLNNTLFSYVPGAVNIQQGTNTTVPDAVLTAGDITGDNQVDIADYDVLRRCFDQQPTGACAAADINDDGSINGFDYNELIRVFASQKGL